MLEVENLHARVVGEERPILQGVNLVVREGEVSFVLKQARNWLLKELALARRSKDVTHKLARLDQASDFGADSCHHGEERVWEVNTVKVSGGASRLRDHSRIW